MGAYISVCNKPSPSPSPSPFYASSPPHPSSSSSPPPAPAPTSSPSSSQRKKKQQPISATSSENPPLIPALPDEISLQILARLPRHTFLSLKLVSRSWHDALVSQEMFDIRKDLGLSEEWLYMLIRDEEEDSLSWHAVDPVSGKWQRLPSLPEVSPLQEEIVAQGSSNYNNSHTYSGDSGYGYGYGYGYGWWRFSSLKIAEIVKGLFAWKDGTEKMSPLCGCAAGAWAGYLYVLGGFSRGRAIANMWRYDPRTNEWQESTPMYAPRAYCKTAILNDKLYALGGVDKTTGSGMGGSLMPLKSAEVYDPVADLWRPIPNMPFSKAQTLPSPIVDHMLKPIATGIASFRGKLCVPQSLYSWPFFVDVGGEVFDPSSESWVEMPKGMGEEWPAKQAGTKLSVVVNGSLYALDPTSSSLDGSKIKVYDEESDSWKVVLTKVPIILDFSDSESPYLLAGFKTRLHVVTKDINDCIVVLRAEADNVSTSSSASETESWKIVARKKFGSVELVTCQVLEV